MKKSVLLFAMAVVLFSSCRKVIGHGPIETEMRPVANFTGISSSISGQVNFTIDPIPSLEVRAQDNILDVLETNVVNGVLEIKFENGTNVSTFREITVNVKGPSVNYLFVNGSGNMHVRGNLVTTNLETKVNGSGKLEIDQATVSNDLEAKMSGSGDSRIYAGTIKNADVSVSGSGGVDISGAQANKADANISGSGYITLHAVQTLDATVSGSGTIRYGGNPVVTTHVSGSGKVRPI